MPSSEAFSASTASRPAFVTCATPLLWDGTARDIGLIFASEKQNYFFERDWTTQITLIRLKKLGFARTSAERAGKVRSPDGADELGARNSGTLRNGNPLKR
jgi:hypothetical protein